MEKRAPQYKLTLAYIKDANGEAISVEPLELTFDNHDDIFAKIER